MNDFIKFSVLLIVFYGVYSLVKNKLDFVNRKRVILSLPVLSLFSIELNRLLLSSTESVSSLVFEMDVFSVKNVGEVGQSQFFDWALLYWLGVIVSLTFLVVKLGKVFLFFRKMKFENKNGIKIYKSDLAGAFTFFNRVHLSNSDSGNSIIIEHETLHAKRKHTIEILVLEFYQIVFWFNPILYLMKYELKQVQEFEVDEILFKKYDTKYIETLLNYSLPVSFKNYLLTSQFYSKLSLAKRTKIMKNTWNKKLKMLLILPLSALVFSFVSITSEGNVNKIGVTQTEKDVIVQPQFIGGNEAFMKYLGENIKYPEGSKKEEKQGKVYAGFKINKRGKIKDVHIKRGINEDLDAEVIRVLKLMPKWIPGTKNGKKQKMEMVIPVNFSLK